MPKDNLRGRRCSDSGRDPAAMQYEVRPDGMRLKFACRYPPDGRYSDPPYPGDCAGEAFPARRLADLAELAKEKVLRSAHNPPTLFEKDGCLCELRCCTIMEELPAGGECGEGKIPYNGGSGRS